MRRLSLIALAVVILGGTPLLAQQSQHAVSTPDTLKWIESRTAPGANMAIVHGDPAKDGPFVYRVRVPANYKVPPHFHKTAENVTVLSGRFFIALGERFDSGVGQALPAGGFVSLPANHPHFAWTTTEETVIQVHGVGPTDTTFVNPADDPRKK